MGDPGLGLFQDLNFRLSLRALETRLVRLVRLVSLVRLVRLG